MTNPQPELGTCDFDKIGTRYHETPHLKAPTCVNWQRASPQEPLPTVEECADPCPCREMGKLHHSCDSASEGGRDEIALKYAREMCGGDDDRKIYLYGGLPEFCGHHYGWASVKEITAIIQRAIEEATR